MTVTPRRYFISACPHVFPKAIRSYIASRGYTLIHAHGSESFRKEVERTDAHCIVLDPKVLAQVANGSRPMFSEKSYCTMLVPSTQLLQIHPYLENGYVDDYITTINKGQICCLLDKVERFHASKRGHSHGRSERNLSHSIEEMVERRLGPVLANLEADSVTGLHSLVMSRIERPLIRMVLSKTNGNQLAAARLLGINRNTLRKRLKDLDLVAKEDEPVTQLGVASL